MKTASTQRRVASLCMKLIAIGVTPRVNIEDTTQVRVDIDILEKLISMAELAHTHRLEVSDNDRGGEGITANHR